MPNLNPAAYFKDFREALDFISNALHLLGILKKKIKHTDGPDEYEIDDSVLRTHAPRLSKKASHEARWTQILGRLGANDRTAILLHFMRNLHEEQQADLVQSAADAAGAVDSKEEQRVLKHLRQIAAIPPDRNQQINRVLYCDGLNWIKKNATDYWIVKIQNVLGKQIEDAQQLWKELIDPANTAKVVQFLQKQLTQINTQLDRSGRAMQVHARRREGWLTSWFK